jgi:hypothetical protein
MSRNPTSRGRDSERMAKRRSCPPKVPQYQTGLVQEGEIKSPRATYGDGIEVRLRRSERRQRANSLALRVRPASPVIGVDRERFERRD